MIYGLQSSDKCKCKSNLLTIERNNNNIKNDEVKLTILLSN